MNRAVAGVSKAPIFSYAASGYVHVNPGQSGKRFLRLFLDVLAFCLRRDAVFVLFFCPT